MYWVFGVEQKLIWLTNCKQYAVANECIFTSGRENTRLICENWSYKWIVRIFPSELYSVYSKTLLNIPGSFLRYDLNQEKWKYTYFPSAIINAIWKQLFSKSMKRSYPFIAFNHKKKNKCYCNRRKERKNYAIIGLIWENHKYKSSTFESFSQLVCQCISCSLNMYL